MGKTTGFLDYERMPLPLRDALERQRDFAPLSLTVSEKNRRRQGGRCMDCGVPFCQAGVRFSGKLLGCPLHNLIPEWNDLLWSGSYEAALRRLLKTNCFPEFTARVCPAPCEEACTCGKIGQSVTVRDNELFLTEYAFENDYMQPFVPAMRSDKSIAVVGSGPAGLAAAYYLNRRGHRVTVLERDAVPGGLLSYGIPEMKLPQAVVARRVALMEREGVRFVTSCAVGSGLSPEALAGQYDLAIFCCGAQQPRGICFPEPAKSGVYYALSYLKAASRAAIEKAARSGVDAAGKNVVVVGAGDSASDCVSVALRQGCKSITQLIRKPKSAYAEVPDHAQEEAQARFGTDIRRYETRVEALRLAEDGALTGVVLSGGEQQTLNAELLLLASGFSGCEASSVQAAEQTEAYGLPVLRAGDMVSGSSLVVLAIADGKRAAAEADRLLMGYTNIL